MKENLRYSGILKTVAPHVLAVIFFLVLSLMYFKPVLDGKTLSQGDISQWRGMAQELTEFGKEHPDVPAVWSGSMFSGMPSYHFGVTGYSPNYMSYIQRSLSLSDPGSMGPVFAGMICAYILFFLLTGNVWIALLGALAYAFSSYNIIILEAGHVTKAWAIAFVPLVLAGFWEIIRKKYLLGGALFAFALATEMVSGHVQITYYLALFCLILFVAYAIRCFINKHWGDLGKVSLTFVIALILAVLPGISGLYADYEMSRLSLRGPSELTAGNENDAPVSTGLDIDYAFQWSYGRGETLSLMIPDIRGGASGGTLGANSYLFKELKENGQPVKKEIQAYTYWGEQPFTSGPVYLGAVICFLFVLGMFVVKNPAKWWLLGAAVFFIFLSWGKNLAGLNDFVFYHLPMYNKFRTPSMALVIPALIFPLVGAWGLKEIYQQRIDKRILQKQLIFSMAITGSICLILWLVPSMFFDFESSNDAHFESQVPEWYYNALLLDRKALLQSDALRSLVFILLSGGAIYLFMDREKKKFNYSLIILGALVLIDLWMVDKRYINDASFVKKTTEKVFEATPADKIILEDHSPSYRVLNISTNTFNETATSYFHKSIGGYHAAKLRRYQELIDFRITTEIQYLAQVFQTAKDMNDIHAAFQSTPTLNMLNMRYLIYNPEAAPVRNPFADGNAWFVRQIQWVDNADDELAALNGIDPKTIAIVDKQFTPLVKTDALPVDSTAFIELVEYQPPYLKYQSETASEQLAVFSEIYYANGWKAFIDGQPAPHFRADWVLRAMYIPAGKHTIEFRFAPDTYNVLAITGSTASILIIIGFFAVLIYFVVQKRKQ